MGLYHRLSSSRNLYQYSEATLVLLKFYYLIRKIIPARIFSTALATI
jgi:hypothetical protein